MINVFLFVILLSGWDQPHRCSYGVSFVGPSATRAVLLVQATGRTSFVPVPQEPLFTAAIPDSVREVPGFQFRVIAVQGGTTRLNAGDFLIAVPWQYDEACNFEEWGSEEWVPPGAEAVFTISEFREHGGVVVSDRLGWHSPYPYGEFLKYEARSSDRRERGEWLSAREYYDMVLALPPEDTTMSSAERALDTVRVIENGNPRWRARFPGNELLRRLKTYLRTSAF